ncbi:MAG: TraX family protein [Lachnospiraceae bacterium]|nr:TraX family protein [Lachnospiraceae bacterium]
MPKTEITCGRHFGRPFLKIAAMLSMLCDHIAFVLIPAADYPELYYIMRAAGRIAFPLFCFMLVEGFTHTHSRAKYIIRLLVFAVISEIPFDLASGGPVFDWDSQNVMWTLLIGFIVMYCIEQLHNNYMAWCIVIIAGGMAAYFMQTDYSIFGVFVITVLYIYRHNKKAGMAVMGILILTQSRIEMFALLSIPLILNYNPDKNNVKLSKYFFYIFYPAHLFILYIIYYFHGSL